MAFEVQNPFQNLIANPWDELTMEEDGGLFVESIVTTNTQSKDGKNKDKVVKTFGNGDKEIIEYQHTKAADETISLLDNNNKIPGFFADGFQTTYSGNTENNGVFIESAFDGTEKSAMEAYLGDKKYEAGKDFFKALLSSGVSNEDNNIDLIKSQEARINEQESLYPNSINEEMLKILERTEAEKQDDYYDVTDPNSSKFFDRSLGQVLTGTGMQRKPIQNKNYGMTTSAEDQAIFDNAREKRRLSRVAGNTAQQDEMDSGYFNMEKARIDQQIQEASNAQNTVNQSGADNESLDTPIIGNDEVVNGVTAEDIAIIGASANGQSMAEEFGNDLAAANGDPAKIDAAKAEFGDGLFDLAEYDPQLAKSLFAMMGAMLMGESFGDAMATGFGVMEEAAMEEEAANKAAADEVVALLIDNAEYLSDDVFFATLAQYNLSDEQLKDITMKYGIAKSAAQNKKTATDLATALTDLNKFEKDIIALYTDSDNVGAVAPKIRQLLTYVHDQLNNQANPTWLLDPKNRENRDALEEAIGTYATRYDQYVAMGDEGRGMLERLVNGGMEAIWEGQRGTVGMTDGNPAMGKVLVPESQEPLMMAITSIANIKMPDEKKRNQYLAEQHQYWSQNIKGKQSIAYNEEYKKVVNLGFLAKPQEHGYLGWLYNKIKMDTM